MDMRAVFLNDPSQPDSLELRHLPIPEPGEGEVRVRLTSIGLNRADLLYPNGKYFIKPVKNSRIGFEGAGIVDACGANTRLKEGDAVGICPMSYDVTTQGCLADYGIYKETELLPSPNNLDPAETGSIWMAYLTAWGGLVDAGGLQQDEHVVITAASSSVGIAAIQLTKQLNAISIATTTSEEKAALLREAGADHVIVQSRGEDGITHYVEQVREITQGEGSDLVFDAVAGPATHGLVKASKREGRVIIHGLLDRRPMDIHAGVLMKRLLTLKGYTLDQTLSDANKKAKAVEMLRKGFEQGLLHPTIAQTFSLEDFHMALACLGENRHTGKIVITP